MPINKITYFVLGLCLFSMLPSCGKNKHVISKSQMEDVIYDMQLAQAVYQTRYSDFSTDAQKLALFNGVLEKHGITKAVLDSSLVWYSDHLDVYVKINDSVASRLRSQELIYEGLYNKEMNKLGLEQSDFPSYFYLTSDQPYFAFNLDSTKLSNLDIASVDNISFDVLGSIPDTKVNTSLRFEYSDTTIVRSQYIDSLTTNLNIKPEADKKLHRLSGYIRVEPSNLLHKKLLFYHVSLNKNSSASISTESANPQTQPLQRNREKLTIDKQ